MGLSLEFEIMMSISSPVAAPSVPGGDLTYLVCILTKHSIYSMQHRAQDLARDNHKRLHARMARGHAGAEKRRRGPPIMLPATHKKANQP